MKKAVLFLSILVTSLFAQADLGSAEIYLMKSDYSFDFIALSDLNQPLINKIPTSPANIQTLTKLDPKYFQVCFDGAALPLQELLFALGRNEGQVGETVVLNPIRAVAKGLVEFTYQVGEKSPVTLQISRCDF